MLAGLSLEQEALFEAMNRKSIMSTFSTGADEMNEFQLDYKGVSLDEFVAFWSSQIDQVGWSTVEARTRALVANKRKVETRKAEDDGVVKASQESLGLEKHVVNEEQRSKIKLIFSTLDADNSGYVNYDEFRTVPGPDAVMRKLFEAIDHSSDASSAVGSLTNFPDNQLSLSEFLAFYESCIGTDGWEAVSEHLDHLDWKRNRIETNPDQLKAERVFEKVDTSQDGKS